MTCVSGAHASEVQSEGELGVILVVGDLRAAEIMRVLADLPSKSLTSVGSGVHAFVVYGRELGEGGEMTTAAGEEDFRWRNLKELDDIIN